MEAPMSEREFVWERSGLPEKYPFTQWHAYGSPAYGMVPTDPLVEFVDQQTGRRTVIIDETRRIVNFPGIENEEEIEEELQQFEETFEELRIGTLLTGPYDRDNAIVTLHAGAGGTESCDWTGMLYRMYTLSLIHI